MIAVYSKPDCPHCVLAIEYLSSLGADFTKIDVTQDTEALAFIKARGHKTVPQIYIGDRLLVEGGNSGLRVLSIEELFRRIANG